MQRRATSPHRRHQPRLANVRRRLHRGNDRLRPPGRRDRSGRRQPQRGIPDRRLSGRGVRTARFPGDSSLDPLLIGQEHADRETNMSTPDPRRRRKLPTTAALSPKKERVALMLASGASGLAERLATLPYQSGQSGPGGKNRRSLSSSTIITTRPQPGARSACGQRTSSRSGLSGSARCTGIQCASQGRNRRAGSVNEVAGSKRTGTTHLRIGGDN